MAQDNYQTADASGGGNLIDVFISYARSNREKVERLKERLEAMGLVCFYDLAGIDGGADFPKEIYANLQNAKAVVSFWSPIYFTRPWCMIECSEAMKRGILVPAKIEHYDESSLPGDFRKLNRYDLSEESYSPLGTPASNRGEVRGWHEQWTLLAKQLGRLIGRDLIQITSALDAREQLIAHCLRLIEPSIALEFLREQENNATFDNKLVWAVLKRQFYGSDKYQTLCAADEDLIALAYRLKGKGELAESVVQQLSYIEASQQAADMGVPDAENANDRARAEVRRLLRGV